MKSKRMKKLLMAKGFSRNQAEFIRHCKFYLDEDEHEILTNEEKAKRLFLASNKEAK